MTMPERPTVKGTPCREFAVEERPQATESNRGMSESLHAATEESQKRHEYDDDDDSHSHAGRNSIRANVRFNAFLGALKELNEIGTAMPFLAYVIGQAGPGSRCEVLYRQVAEACDASPSTVKLWAKRVEELGYITRGSKSSKGVWITVNDILPVAVDGALMRLQAGLEEMRNQLKIHTTITHTLCQTIYRRTDDLLTEVVR